MLESEKNFTFQSKRFFFRGEVRYAPPTDYLEDELWNITMIVQHKLQNFNPQQVKLVVRNITEFDSTFVMEPYDQDRILKDGKIAKVNV